MSSPNERDAGNAELIEERRLRVIEDRVAVAIANLFVRNPELVGFYLQDAAGFQNTLNPPAKNDVSILDVGLSMPLGEKAHDDMRQRIRDALTRILSERPEAFEMIRDRAFARVFH